MTKEVAMAENVQLVEYDEFLEHIREAVDSPENRYYFSQTMGKDAADASFKELEDHWKVHGGQEELSKRYRALGV